MSAQTPIFGRRNYGLKTATANTAYLLLIEPMSVAAYTYLEFAQFTTQTTAHVLTVMRPLSSRLNTGSPPVPCSCYLTAAAAASATALTVSQDPGVFTAYNFDGTAVPKQANNVIANLDNIAYQYPDGTWEINTASGAFSSGAFNITTALNSNLGLPAGTPVWFFGIKTDTNPYDGKAHPTFNLYAPANPTTINFGSEGVPWIGTFNKGQPLLLSVDNATSASTLERATALYSDRGSGYAW